MRKPPDHVAIVGCGFAGTSALHQLVERHPVRRITVFEASGRFGPGYPYQPDECPDYLINNTTETMCLAPENRRAFADWLDADAARAPGFDPTGHLPRAQFGRFLEDAVATARASAAAKDIQVDLVAAEVTDIEDTPDGAVTLAAGGRRITADACLLTLGRCPDRPPIAATGGARVIADHVMTTALDDLAPDAEVHILGASLSAYDVVNRLFGPATGCRFVDDGAGGLAFLPGPNRRRVTMAARGGRLKAVTAPRAPGLALRHFTLANLRALADARGGLTLEDVAGLIRAEAESAGATLDPAALADPYRGATDVAAVTLRAADLMEAAIAAARVGGAANFLVAFFGAAQETIWDAFAERLLRADEEARYRDRFESVAQAFHAPCPIPTAARLVALMRAGRLRLLTGVGQPMPAPGGILLSHRFGEEVATTLVDTTNRVDRDVTSPGQPPLVRALVGRGLLSPYRVGGRALGAAVDMADLRLPGSRSIHLIGMLLWGPGFFTSSAFMMARAVRTALAATFATPPRCEAGPTPLPSNQPIA
jgi:hypothetical protein